MNLTGSGSETFELLKSSAVLLLFAALADLLDGAVARKINGESDFGLVFDSLADAISFGVAPSILLLKGLALEVKTSLSFFAVIAAMLFTLCGVLRLVRFNIKAMDTTAEDDKKHFFGLPIPAGAAGAVSINLFLNSPYATAWLAWSVTTKAIVLSVASIFLGYLMISRWRFASLKTFHIQVPPFHLILATAIAAIVVLYGILYCFSLLLLLLAWGYIIFGVIISIVRSIKNKGDDSPPQKKSSKRSGKRSSKSYVKAKKKNS